MKIKVLAFLLIPACLTSYTAGNAEKYRVIMNNVTAEKVNKIIRTEVIPASSENHGEIVDRVSAAFLTTPYRSETLIGSPKEPEALVADFEGVDCFVLADYVEALSRSNNKETFLKNLARICYVNGKVSYLSRRHFFTDWYATFPRNARDITPNVSSAYVTVKKWLNRKSDGRRYVKGLEIIPRKINYIPGPSIDVQVLNQLKTGDYVGIYSPREGLDVSHAGIIIRRNGQVWFRNASSLQENRKVVDSPFMEYMLSKPGIIVLRAD
ncbi:hypothetical protein BAnh1_09940 [Bartonella australis AUST/NH1]|uniref:DUF1460 domain-containing protein n=1 Tax=Bartonella australis (strain Aust/NH1) TaxID=1094489 RepID=M1N4N8_BARAA|nr:DUF1460 domain-containing protein [Bartonella australis]AGF74864.1 hypothetical protein BAnh1_09940 [Bartonella australis AUST/NH1]